MIRTLLAGAWLVLALLPAGTTPSGTSVDGTRAGQRPAKVRIVQHDGGYQLLVDGSPFHIKGAGLQSGNVEALRARGGNSFRTWRPGNSLEEGLALLDRAQASGLRVTLGLEVARERHGFDYDDTAAVARQLARVKAEVLAYKDHPALLMWAVGNELNLESSNPRVWDAVDQMASMIHKVDPNHPVLTTLAGFDKSLVDTLKARAPHLDLIGIQLYGDIEHLEHKLEASEWTGPYVVTEWGPTGHWEVPLTAWGAPIEDDSTRKADVILDRYLRFVDRNPDQCLGSYVFLWGQKQERTPTWYGVFLASGESTAAVDSMEFAWTGHWPDNRSPAITPIELDAMHASDDVVLRAGHRYRASVKAHDPDSDPLDYQWRVMQESSATSSGGDREVVPPEVDVAVDVVDAQGASIRLRAPAHAGTYRLFVTVRDGQGHAAHANLPFKVMPRRAR